MYFQKVDIAFNFMEKNHLQTDTDETEQNQYIAKDGITLIWGCTA